MFGADVAGSAGTSRGTDRAQGRLDIQGLWIEAPGLAADRAFRASLDRSLQQFAETLGARDLHVSTAARL